MHELAGPAGPVLVDSEGGPRIVAPVDLEEHSLDPVIKRACEQCGAELTRQEIEASLDAGGPYLCSAHAVEEVPLAEEDEPDP